MMKPPRAGSGMLIFAFVFILVTAALSIILREATKSSPQGTELSSFTVRIEAGKPVRLKSQYTFAVSCIFSGSGDPCQPHSSQGTVYPGIFSFMNLTAAARPGNYRGVRVEIPGRKGESLQIRSVLVQDEKVFDGKDISVFRNLKGIRITPDSAAGLALFEITSDTASFELGSGFKVTGVRASAIRYTSAVMAAVIFLSAILLMSVLGAAARRRRGMPGRRTPGAAAAARRLTSPGSPSACFSPCSSPGRSSSGSMSLCFPRGTAGRSASPSRSRTRLISGMRQAAPGFTAWGRRR